MSSKEEHSSDDFLDLLKKIAANLEKQKTKEYFEKALNSSNCSTCHLAELFADVSNKIGKLSESLTEFKSALDKAAGYAKKHDCLMQSQQTSNNKRSEGSKAYPSK